MLHRTFYDLQILSLKYCAFDHLHLFPATPPPNLPESGNQQFVSIMYVFMVFLFPCGMDMRAPGVCHSVSKLLSIMLSRFMFPCVLIVNDAPVNLGVQLSLWGSVFVFSKKYSMEKLLGLMVVVFIIFRIPHTVCHCGCTDVHSHQQPIGSPHLHMVDHTWCLSLGQLPLQQLWQLTPVDLQFPDDD